MSKDALNVFDLDNYSAGTFFNDGLYRIEVSCFTYFDFGTPGRKSLVMMQELQPLDKSGNKDSAAVTQYWSLMAEDPKDHAIALLEPVNPVKGATGMWKQVRITEANKKDKIYGNAPFTKYMRELQKAGFDMDSAGNDMTALEGLVAEFGKLVEAAKPRTKIQEAEEGVEGAKKQRDQYETVVVTAIPKQSKSKEEKATKKDKEEKAEPATKKNKEQSNEELLAEYLDKDICVKANKEDGVVRMSVRLGLSGWLAQTKEVEPKRVREILAVFNDDDKLNTILSTMGWKIGGPNDKHIVVED